MVGYVLKKIQQVGTPQIHSLDFHEGLGIPRPDSNPNHALTAFVAVLLRSIENKITWATLAWRSFESFAQELFGSGPLGLPAEIDGYPTTSGHHLESGWLCLIDCQACFRFCM